MNENNNAKQPELSIKSLKISSNRDGSNTYSVEIETSAHTIVYPKTYITFMSNQSIAFPVEVRVLDEDNNALFNYALNLNEPDPDQEKSQEESSN